MQIQTVQPVEVRLEIQLERDEVVLSWPEGGFGTLELCESLDSANWVIFDGSPDRANGYWQVRVPVDGSEKYYRLRMAE